MCPENPLPAEVGRYSVVRELGRGAMGRVLLAMDPVLGREVALKHLRGDLALAPEQRSALLERMRQEARASARVNHPHLVALFDMGEDPALGLYLVFEYVEGPTLHERLKQGPLPVHATAKLVRELGAALAYAHGRGIVHRDVKPENVILSAAGSKLADFGIARVPDSTLTQGTGIVLGTPAYSAPEALRGAKFSPASDQFSLGATLYEALSGRRAFPGDDALAVAARIAHEEPVRISQITRLPATVDRVFAKALAKSPKQRFASCAEFGMALSSALTDASQDPAVSRAAPVRPEQATLPDQFHLERAGRPALLWTLAVATTSIAATWAIMTFVDPRPTAASQARVETPQPAAWVEENPPAVAWLAPSPDEDVPEARGSNPLQDRGNPAAASTGGGAPAERQTPPADTPVVEPAHKTP